jgi:hypothetical protein
MLTFNHRVRNSLAKGPFVSAIERAKRDIEEGDYGAARQRLRAYLATKGYEQEIVARLGQISYEMHDMYEAGRFWLLSDAEGSHADHAISCFLKRAGKDPRQIVSQLPHTVRLRSLDEYPEAVRARLRSLALDEAISQAGRGRASKPPNTWGDRAVLSGCILVLLFGVVVFCVGLWQIGRWLFG